MRRMPLCRAALSVRRGVRSDFFLQRHAELRPFCFYIVILYPFHLHTYFTPVYYVPVYIVLYRRTRATGMLDKPVAHLLHVPSLIRLLY